MVGDQTIPRSEYPRPQFIRKDNWINLNGTWRFRFDDGNKGLKERWYNRSSEFFEKDILVPFCFQSKLSGIHDESFHNTMWYYKKFKIPSKGLDKRILLHFGAVDYNARIYLNANFVGSHEGGYTPFTIDISDFAQEENEIIVRVEDPSKDNEIPRGKQFWQKDPGWIFYPRVSGIWQTVWIEFVSKEHYIQEIKITPNIDEPSITIECYVSGKGYKDLRIKALVNKDAREIAEYQTKLDFLGDIEKKRKRRNLLEKQFGIVEKLFKIHPANKFEFKMSIPKEDLELWDIEHPFLYDLSLHIYDKNTQKIYDQVESYFGMREISLSEGQIEIKTECDTITTQNKVILLNKKPVYQKLFLVQGYWADGLYTAPTDAAMKKDIDLIKQFGFNGLRTHQKAFDPRYLYWCDKLGVLVWGEMGSPYAFSTEAQKRFINEYINMIERDYNHPSIIAWTLLNEGWGVPGAEFDACKAHYTLSLYHLVKSIDSTRLVIDDDGWYHTKTDLCTKHFYTNLNLLPDTFEEEKTMNYPEDYEPSIYLHGFGYENEPIVYSEVGGYTLDYNNNIENPVGYGKVNTSEELFSRVIELLKVFDKKKTWISGFCYTELYDQFQEINGFLTIEREPKFPPGKLKEEVEKLFY
ncbi:MAG: Beta-galactosidase [Promethearchaeota archaeon]|nr:MAG: Beta-galactosidase [Candidatus Lokiarchaeota archaeon]